MSKVLYAASTVSHINSFHLPYIEALKEMGHEVLIMARGEGADFDIPFEKKISSLSNFKLVKKISEILDEEGFDTVILNTSLAAFFIRLAMKKKSRSATVNVVHGYLFPMRARGLGPKLKRGLLLLAERLVRRRTDKVVTMNSEDTEIAIRYRLASCVTECRGMGVKQSGERDKEVLRVALGMSGKKVLFFAGELSRRKNQDFLIRLMPCIREKYPDAELWLAGDGDELNAQTKLCRTLGLSNSVRHLGRIDNARDYMAACDVYVSASDVEGLPFNIVEALMEGASVVASDVKGHRDILQEGAGLLFVKDDPKDAADKILAILNNDSVIDLKARKDASERYEFNSVFGETLLKITTTNERIKE